MTICDKCSHDIKWWVLVTIKTMYTKYAVVIKLLFAVIFMTKAK
jgi:hypothetical protein